MSERRTSWILLWKVLLRTNENSALSIDNHWASALLILRKHLTLSTENLYGRTYIYMVYWQTSLLYLRIYTNYQAAALWTSSKLLLRQDYPITTPLLHGPRLYYAIKIPHWESHSLV